jgi:hypothetical protein
MRAYKRVPGAERGNENAISAEKTSAGAQSENREFAFLLERKQVDRCPVELVEAWDKLTPCAQGRSESEPKLPRY